MLQHMEYNKFPTDTGTFDQHVLRPMTIDGVDHGTISFDPASMLVCKSYPTVDAAETTEQIRREFDYLERFSAVLADEPYLQCPRPVWAEPENGRMWMTYCPGSQLHHVFAESNQDIDVHLEHIARQIDLALERYIDAFHEPFHGLATWNMLYQPSIRTVCLVDFTGRAPSRQDVHEFPLEASLGHLIGSSIYHTVRMRRSSWRNYSYWRRQKQLLLGVLGRSSARHNLHVPVIMAVSTNEFNLLARRGRLRRRLWFATGGQLLFAWRRRHVIAESLCID